MKAKLALATAAALAITWAFVHLASRQATPAAPQEQTRRTTATVERKPWLPAPRLPSTPPPTDAAAESRLTTNLVTRLLNGEVPRLTAEPVEPRVLKNSRRVESLLGAFDVTDAPARVSCAATRIQPMATIANLRDLLVVIT